ncbi:PaaI family thioesterase [Phaeovibrio sulfidiphilus]|uniref:Medium/long-chain acyl-CoA thioesterase YigI n=1 Tax=Phaeovibrio sulfidiphilus TaxID=1220600 RepID=A0A8J7CQF4_9PROT|nr:PaaI family thioesterase [Phaeovibrio sulfidiphilus]MBE1236765.1 PaaI family thioesterase [Phaeovibrio sulfidiphilus]
MPKSYLKAVLKPGQCANLLLKTLGGRVEFARDGLAEIRIPASPDLCQGGGLIGGGVLATAADEAMAHAVLSCLEPDVYTVTLDMNIRYLRAVRSSSGGEILARASLVKKGRSVMVAGADVLDDGERLVAIASATFLVTPKTS